MLQQKYSNYINLIKEQQDKFGFIDSDHCDSLLFTGLVGIDNKVVMNIEAAQDPNSKLWFRRPLDRPCYPDHSKSTISRDMTLGLLYYCYFNKRADLVQELLNTIIKNKFIIGKAVDLKTTIGRCLITPTLLSTIALLNYKLGNKSSYNIFRFIPVSFNKNVTGFEAHLQVLHAYLRDTLNNSNNYKDIYKHHYSRQPNNAFFALASGDLDFAVSSLLNEQYWPLNRLPTERDRSEGWLFQRDYGKDWLPSEGDKVHSGGDFIFLYSLL